MPPVQFEVSDGRRYRIRHVKPDPAGSTVVLGITYGFEWLPADPAPHSKDLASGSWTGRLGDAGEFQLTFPNTTASDGVAWRDRFDVSGHLEFVEIHREDTLEFVGVIVKVPKDRNQVVVSGWDGWFLLKKCYVRDQQILMGPRDLIETYTSVPVALCADGFLQQNGLDLTKWSQAANGGSVLGRYGSVLLSSSPTGPAPTPTSYAGIASLAGVPAGVPWSLTVEVGLVSLGSPSSQQQAILVAVSDNLVNTGNGAVLSSWNGYNTPTDSSPTGVLLTYANGQIQGGGSPGAAVLNTLSYTLLLESNGRWVRGYVNGVLVGVQQRPDMSALLHASVKVQAGASAVVSSVLFRTMAPLLTRGSDRGDWVLPSGNAPGGLHGRYYNDLDRQNDYYHAQVLIPSRVSYADRLDGPISLPAPPQPGAGPGGFWSARWFGAIYLKLSAGSYQLSVLQEPGVGARLWVGKTTWGAQIIDNWTPASANTQSNGYVDAVALGGRDGWYPIVLEGFNFAPAGSLTLALSSSPATYVDPGGTTVAYGAQLISVPASSLAPFGVVDDRYQGQSQFDIVQKVADAYGYQACVEPMALESGEFPGRLAPRVREGRDYDEIIEPDDLNARSPITNYQLSTDATDQVTGLYGSGGKSADAQGGKVTVEVFDVASIAASLFDLQGWVDAGDISNPGLLAARINSQLGLQLAPWESIVGDPTARDRLSDTFPLTGALNKLRWRPGDGVRLRLPDVGLEDHTPRQTMQVTREFTSEGRTATKIGFRQRPRDPSYLIREALRAATVPQRQSAPQPLTLAGTYILASVNAGASTPYSIVALLPQDTILTAHVRIAYMSPAGATDIAINGALSAYSLGGPWSNGAPVEINILGFATAASSIDTRLYVQLKNVSSAAIYYEFQLIVTVLR